MTFFSRWLRKPLAHFLIIGGSLFLAQRAWDNSPPPKPVVQEDLVISKNQIEQLKNDIFVQTGTRATEEQLARLIQIEIDNEVLYREALGLKLGENNPSVKKRLVDLARIAEDSRKSSEKELYKKALNLGLDRHDPVIRRLLIGTMQLIAKKIPTHNSPAKVAIKDMEAYFEAHAADFRKPVQMKFSHLYFSRDKRKADAKKQADLLLKKLLSGAKLEELSDKGDAFLGGDRFSYMAASSLDRLFGLNFSHELNKAASGKWSGPFQSTYGWHLVFVEDVRPARAASLSEVENQIKSILLKEREEKRLSETLQKLRLRYKIVIEGEGAPNV